MSAGAQDRTERATPQRRREARKRGQVPRSRELSAAAVVGAGVLGVVGAGAHLGRGAVRLMRRALDLGALDLAHPDRLPAQLGRVLTEGLMLAAPLFAATFCAALVAPLALGGWNLSAGALRPDFSRLNPFSGLGRMFSGQAAVELAKGLAKVACIGGVAAVYLWRERGALVALAGEPVQHGIADAAALVAGAFAWLAAALLLIAAVDAPYQLWSYARRLRMSRQEVRDELKQSEGRPEVKARIRRLQHEVARRRMMEKIPSADVVVTNPTHYAVALKYRGEEMRAPRVVAKGAGEIAARIRELAREHRVPQVSAPPLARALYRGVDLDQEIPANLYAAVARVLTYVYQLRNWRGGRAPAAPVIDAVPGGEPDESWGHSE
ncbi:MAG: flagellar biosynthesis protein FlhB [Nevskia sp.]|nr:flagellar biosynthesis protein FlhB [Nevskia sp.]